MLTKEEMLQFKIFEGLNLEELDAILDISQEVFYKSGNVILAESGFRAESDFFVILQGNVRVEMQSSQTLFEGQGNTRLAVLKSGDVFGEMGLLRGKRRSAQVSAYSDLTARRVNQKKFFQLFVNNPRLGYLIMRNIAAILVDRITDMNFMFRNEM